MKTSMTALCLVLWWGFSRNDHGMCQKNEPTPSEDHDLAKKRDNRSEEALSRERRTLVFYKSPNVVLTIGMGTPLQLDRESVIVGVFTKLLYALPGNASDFTEPGVYYSRTGRSRWSIYKVLETAGEIYGFGGKGCLLRAICEATHAPFDVDHGLFGQLVQAFFTPSSTGESYEEYGDREYHAAERLGKHPGRSCHALYPECRRSILDVFSTTGP
ncbi:uncharacterized protein LOC105701925 [Orussus abietinus]|uniref:uncharacterized protein LOC105701925 n=1 Tax=Orussus abietinus TaxID=222816 RepID=UPI000626B5B5|nr:uncharacterized protein LOC105701925 [Orussus abietinus]